MADSRPRADDQQSRQIRRSPPPSTRRCHWRSSGARPRVPRRSCLRLRQRLTRRALREGARLPVRVDRLRGVALGPREPRSCEASSRRRDAHRDIAASLCPGLVAVRGRRGAPGQGRGADVSRMVWTSARATTNRTKPTRERETADLAIRRWRLPGDQPGIRRRVFNGDDMRLCFWRIDDGPSHALRRSSRQRAVRADHRGTARLPDRQRRADLLGPGDIYYAPKGIPHGDSRFIGDPRNTGRPGSSTSSPRCGRSTGMADWRLAVDIGGTFTDVVLLDGDAAGSWSTRRSPRRRVRSKASRRGWRRCSRRPGSPPARSRRRSCTPRRWSPTR